MRIAVLGTGSVGSSLATALQAAGHDVARGSRSPRPDDGTVGNAEAVNGADVVLTALPGQAVLPTLEHLGGGALEGKVVLDVSNAFTEDFTLEYPGDSVALQVQQRFPRARVVKSLNTMNVAVMTDPSGTAPGSSVFLSGDDEEAKRAVRGLLGDLGWAEASMLDLGGIATSIATEHYALLFLALMGALGTPEFNIAVIR
ncbi:NAD(P)-binding domain-containing protein [Brachybacterium sp. Marseille-Q2903]|uniref:NAD(P)-binding domain-containing protein n=1 Tax=Brachybacterium epidermidis TaxID=2781983 RepID=A0ABR9W3H0_9MICO|nr:MULTISPECIES: NAD(P)-binding domain-containing protein [Brachybacterium]MBE9404994.1 NAD(P)-binding domain-containing protein [Brachybacterium epidermidis]MCT1776831.1 NAD(P)-binding domain-containing protein [Brachybacterium sp. p3-SID957]